LLRSGEATEKAVVALRQRADDGIPCPPNFLCYRGRDTGNSDHTPSGKKEIAMAEKDIVKHLKSLLQLDVDASHAYQQAIDRIELVSVREQLTKYREDHERHVREISEKLRELGETPPKASPDLKGMMIEGFTALRSMTGTEGALKAMKTNEKLTNRKYDEARKMNVAADVQQLLESNYQDERRHLTYVEEALQSRIWE